MTFARIQHEALFIVFTLSAPTVAGTTAVVLGARNASGTGNLTLNLVIAP